MSSATAAAFAAMSSLCLYAVVDAEATKRTCEGLSIIVGAHISENSNTSHEIRDMPDK